MMASAGIGGDIVYVVSKNAIAAGPENIAYGAAKADQAHQVRLLAAELGDLGIRVNGVNPDGVVEGSGIFDGAWREARAAAHGVAPEDLGDFYAHAPCSGRAWCRNMLPTPSSPWSGVRCRARPAFSSPSTVVSPPHSCADRNRHGHPHHP